MTFYCLQLLCPQRHCLQAGSYDDESGNFDVAVEGMEVLMPPARGPYCMLCGSEDLHYEARPYRRQGDRETRRETQIEIAADMMVEQQEQTANRERLRRLRIPPAHWPSGLRWNYDHLLNTEEPAIFRHLRPRGTTHET